MVLAVLVSFCINLRNTLSLYSKSRPMWTCPAQSTTCMATLCTKYTLQVQAAACRQTHESIERIRFLNSLPYYLTMSIWRTVSEIKWDIGRKSPLFNLCPTSIWRPKTRVPGLSKALSAPPNPFAVLTKHRIVTDRRMDTRRQYHSSIESGGKRRRTWLSVLHHRSTHHMHSARNSTATWHRQKSRGRGSTSYHYHHIIRNQIWTDPVQNQHIQS